MAHDGTHKGEGTYSGYTMQLKVDGEEVDIGAFVQNFASATILGMVSQLQGVKEPKQVEISISVD